jgi:hypothetical protein
LLLSVLLLATSVFMAGGTANASLTPVGLGTATTFAIRANSQITDVPPSPITGDVGLSPASGTFDGLTCAEVNAGAGPIYAVDTLGPQACPGTNNAGLMTTVANDALAAFNHTAALPGATPIVGADLTGLTLDPGIYSFGHLGTGNISSGGVLTLNAHGDANAVWIFQASSDIIMESTSTVAFINAPAGSDLACNVFWTAVTSASINTGSTFVGTIMTGASITMAAGSTVHGRLLAGNGSTGLVSLDHDTIIRPTGCTALPAGTGGTTPVAAPTVPGVPALTG